MAVEVHTGDYRNYVLTNRDNDVDAPKLRFLEIIISNHDESLSAAKDALLTRAKDLGATHVFGFRIAAMAEGEKYYRNYVAYGDAYGLLNQDNSEAKS